MNMKRLLPLVAFFATLQASAQQVNPVPDYVFRNQMSVGRNAVTDTAAYFSIGPRYGANKGFMPPIVGDTSAVTGTKRNGLLIFSVQKNKFLYWDSVRVQWSDMAGSSGSYITGSGILGYLPQFTGTTTLDTSALYTLGSRLGIGTTQFAYNSTNTSNIELNNTAGGIIGFKRNDSARGYLWHTGDNMELANTTAGSISFNTNSATRGSISSAGVWRLNNLSGTGDRVVVASSNGTLSAASSATGLVDTLTISTRAWRQKGLDSLAALEVSGSGTTNYVPKFTAASTIGNSQIFDNGTNVGIGTSSPISNSVLDVVSSTNVYPRIRSTGTGEAFQFYQNSTSGTTAGDGLFVGINSTNDAFFYNSEATAARFFTSATERLRITSGGDVGIGTQSPNTKTEIFGGDARVALSAVTTSTFRGYQMATGTTEFASLKAEASAGELRLTSGFAGFGGFTTFYNNGSERMRIFANGRIGVNTTTDAGYQFDVNGDVRFQGTLYTRSGTNTGIVMANTSAIRNTGTQYFDYGTGGSGEFYFRGGSGFANVLTLMNGGNVGVNTASPVMPFQLNNYGGFDGNGNQLIIRNNVYYNSSNARSEPIQNGYQTQIEMENLDGKIRFSTSSASNNVGTAASLVERMRITNNGEVWINTTTDVGDYKLQVVGNIYNTGNAILSATTGIVGIGTTSPTALASTSGLLHVNGASTNSELHLTNTSTGATATDGGILLQFGTRTLLYNLENSSLEFGTNNTERGRINSAGEWIIDASGTDAGDYKLQVVGNARIGTGKLDIASNTTFGLGVARSGTSEVAGQIYNSNGILYLGAESSTGGQIFTGSSAYAAVIGSGAAYPLQFATDNVTRATINTNGELLINTLTDNGDFKLQVNGSALISGSIQTANPVSGTAVPWRLGSVVATNVQLDTANYVEVNINGTFYRLAIVTPL